MTDTKRQHYVWRHYLKPWTVNNYIWCLRENNLFHPSLEKIAIEKYFYKRVPLNEIELKILVEMIKKTPLGNHFLLFQDLITYCEIGNNSNEFIRKYGLEDYHSKIETNMVPILDCLYKKDLSFLTDNDIKTEFYRFISIQYNRTKCMQERAILATKNLPIVPPKDIEGKFEFNKINQALSFSLLTESIGNWLYSKANIYFLNTDHELIASDQPIINIHSGNIGNFEPVTDCEFYYPLTPYLALFFTEKKSNDKFLSNEEINSYNKMLFEKSYEQVYSLTKKTLEPYLNKSNA